MKVAVVGAGPSGLAASYELCRRGINVDLYESGDEVGGLARSLQMWGCSVEMGAHFLVEDTHPKVKILIDHMLRGDFHRYLRSTRIRLGHAMYDYPPRPLNLFRNLGPFRTAKAFASLLAGRIMPKAAQWSGEQYAQHTFGDYLYRHFFKAYTEKLWGIPCGDIGLQYFQGLIGIGGGGLANVARTLIAGKNVMHHQWCIHPIGGMSSLWRRMAESICHAGGRIHTDSPVNVLAPDGDIAIGIETADGECRLYDHVLSSASETAVLRRTKGAPASLLEQLKRVRFRQVVLVYLKLSTGQALEDNSLYLYGDDVEAVRVTSFNRFVGRTGNDVVMLEYWVGMMDWSDAETDHFSRLARDELARIAAPVRIQVENTRVVRVPNAFAIPDRFLEERSRLAHVAVTKLSGLTMIGRTSQSAFNFGMEGALLDGICAAGALLDRQALATG